MLKRLSQRQILQNLAEEWERALADEWLAAIRSITSTVKLKALIQALEENRLEDAMKMLDLSPERFAPFEAGIISAYHAGGVATVNGMPALRDPSGNRVHFSWGVRNLPAEAALRQHAAALVDDLVGEQLTVARQVLTDGLSRGQNPRQTALGLVGRVNRRTGAREGGVLGNSPSVVERLDRLYLGLRAGDQDVMKAYLQYGLRNKMFDGHVRRALEQGGTVPADAVDRIVTAYSNRALKYRGDQIALHETRIALSSARRDAFQQQIDNGKLDADDLTKTWRRSISKQKRQDHLAMVGTTIPFGQKFTLPSGYQCDGPHDPTLPASETIGCTCDMDVSVDFTAQALRKYRARIGG